MFLNYVSKLTGGQVLRQTENKLKLVKIDNVFSEWSWLLAFRRNESLILYLVDTTVRRVLKAVFSNKRSL